MLTSAPRLARVLRSRWLWAYLALVAASQVVIAVRSGGVPDPPEGAQRVVEVLPRMNDAGPARGTAPIAALRWAPAKGDGAVPRTPIVLLHGSPSSGGRDFKDLGPLLAQHGHEVLAIDLPGFGASTASAPSYSILAYARVLEAFLDARAIERAHLVGWSQGGGAALVLADRAPARVASLTLMGAIGTQETEGSGDYHFERLKYRLGQVALVALPEVVPHFGLLGPRRVRSSFLRNFLDSDLRPMRALMARIGVPTLILHGRHDPLVPAWAAETHHRLIKPSTLVMLDASHFLPLRMGGGEQFEQSTRHLLAFIARHERPGVTGLRGEAVFASASTHINAKLGGFSIKHDTPWWAVIAIICVAAMISEDLTVITVGLLMVSQSIDWGVGLIGCFVAIVIGDALLWLTGRLLGRRVLRLPLLKRVITEQGLEKWGRVLDTHTGKAVLLSRCVPGTRLPTFLAAGILSRRPWLFLFWVAVAAFVWTPFLLLMTALVGPSLLEVFRTVFHGPWAIVAAIVVLYVVIRLVSYETTTQGRHKLIADLRRWVTPEFWPTWAFYLPLVPYYAYLSLRHGGVMAFSATNPGIAAGGGLIGESKTEILRGLAHEGSRVLPAALVPAGESADARAVRIIELLRARPELGGYPVVLKPDHGFRGFAMRVARSESDVRAYTREVKGPVQVQAYHPGPFELSLLWARVPPRSTNGTPRQAPRVDDWPGEIFSATGKQFPVIVGDGKHTLEHLIWNHPRFCMQAGVFLKRHAGQTDRILRDGEEMRLAEAGNHCQGTKFTDAMACVTPALAARIDAMARAFRDPTTGGALDFGRFDLRYESEDSLARGEGFGIIELNGTSSESTSMYDPGRSIWWTYRLLLGHWRRLFEIGAARRREGVRAMTVAELFAGLRQHRRGRSGSPISD